MKKLLFALIAIAVVACQQEPKIDYALLSGNVGNSKATVATVKSADFEKELTINTDGSFMDTLHITENGFYTLSIGREFTPLYLKSGDNVSLDVDAQKFDESITYSGVGASENNYLATKTLNNGKVTANAVEFYALDEAAFKTQLEEMQNKNESNLSKLTDADEDFLATEKQNLLYDNYAMLSNYVQRHGYYTKKEGFEVSEDFLPEPLKTMVFDDAKAYKSSQSYKSMAFDKVLTAMFDELGDDITAIGPEQLSGLNDIKIQALKNDTIDYLGSFLVSPGNPQMEAIYNFFKNNTTNDQTLAKLSETFEKNKNLIKGKPSPQFTNYENHKGGETSLSDLKGKYVYVDVWATWCGPCIREIPSLKEVEKKFHSENIEFVSTSIDQARDHDKWVSMVNDKDLGGLQLMADNDWNSKFVKDYAIQGIPRFILIDPEGNIVSADAPRPSDPKLIELLEEQLKM